MSRISKSLMAAVMLGAMYGGDIGIPSRHSTAKPDVPRRNRQTHHGSYRIQVEAARKTISRSCKGRNKRKGKR